MIKWIWGALLIVFVIFFSNKEEPSFLHAYEEKWDLPTLPQSELAQVNQILKQPFYYKNEGKRSTAFVSQDTRYILKLFKTTRKDLGLKGYKLAYEMHRDESGILYFHPSITHSLNTQISIDKKTIDPNQFAFVLQLNATRIGGILKEAVKKGDLTLAKERIRQLLDLCSKEYKKGIFDKDSRIMYNTGLIGNRLIRFDVGLLSRVSKWKRPNKLQRILQRMDNHFNYWLQKNFPEEYPELLQEARNGLDKIKTHSTKSEYLQASPLKDGENDPTLSLLCYHPHADYS